EQTFAVNEHMLSRALTRKQEQVVFQSTQPDYGGGYVVTNEVLAPFTDTLQYIDGAVVTIGADMGLDMLASSSADLAILVDTSIRVSLTTRLLLELPLHFAASHQGRVPTLRELAQLFDLSDPTCRERAETVIQSELSSDSAFLPLIKQYIKMGMASKERTDTLLSFAHYLLIKSTLPTSWLSSPEKIAKILQLYADGKIIIMRQDITSSTIASHISSILSDHQTSIGAMHLMNVEEYINKPILFDRWSFANNAVILRSIKGKFFSSQAEYELPTYPIFGDARRFASPDWHYNVESIGHFKQRLASSAYNFNSNTPRTMLLADSKVHPDRYASGVSVLKLPEE
nr:hypothetical protein [Candidatus Woesebacteria bacterium]